MADATPKSYSTDPTLYLYTSLTAGSSHITTATSRLETILKANKIPFRALDVATDEKARMLWGRRSKGKKLPGLVKYGSIVGDLEEIEEWNEYGELKQQIGGTPAAATVSSTSATNTPSKPLTESISGLDATPKPSSEMCFPSPPGRENLESADPSSVSGSENQGTPLSMAIRQAGAEAAKKAGEKKGSMSRVPASANGLEATAVPMPTVETKMVKTVEEPSASAGTTAAKIPEKLAEEGAKRTSVDKIAKEGAKRTSLDKISGSDGANEQGQVDLSREARRASGITKLKSPLSEDAATTSRTEPETADLGSNSRTHQDSGVSSASKEEIQSVERKDAIPEEPEESGEPTMKAEDEGTGAATMAIKEAARNLEGSTGGKTREVAASSEGEMAATKGTEPQRADARDPKEAGTSVGD